ncbi:MAG: NADH-quinone oxidoreductase subunit NuoG [Anaerolineae bacterium]|nr:NADH-quinone oxidoreductase subunit NuoG [Anaerolineae bacterium]
MTQQITLTIDGFTVTVPPGTLIVEAAKKIGKEIPVFCYHAKMEPVGMCRMCLVEVGAPVINRDTGEPVLDEHDQPVIRFSPKPVTACTTPVSPGMVVNIDSEAALADRKAVLEFLLTSHPLDCPVCDKGGECPLQDLTLRHGPGLSRFDYEDKQHFPKKYPLGDLIVLDMERCIICARCVRFQDEIAHDPVLALEERGRYAHIVSYSNPPFNSHYSGNTTDICPVGALTTRDFRFGARPWELTNVPSICNHCGVGCNTVLGTRAGTIRRVMPRQNEAVNEIWLCDKGRFGHHFNGSPRRLTMPLVRRQGQLVETDWREALRLVAEKFTAVKETYGPNALGGIAGARLPNEDLYLFQKFFREIIGTHNLDHRVGLNAALADETAFTVGVGAGTDLGRVGRGTTLLVIGSDLDQEAPILYLRVAGAAARRGAQVINAGGRRTKLDAQAQTRLRYRYGTAAHLALGLLASVVGQGLLDQAFVDTRAVGLAGLKKALADYPLNKVADITGVPAVEIEAAAAAFARADNGIIIFGLEAGNDPALRAALEALALVTGHAGKPNNGLLAVLPHANSRGAADMGLAPDRLPGYVPLEGEPGLSALEMLGQTPKKSPVKAMLIAGADPAAESESYRAALGRLDFLAVQDLFLTETAQLAHVVLPACGVAERDGSFTNLERRVQVFDPGAPAPGRARPDWLILTALAGQMGADWAYASADGVMAEITRAVPLYAGMEFANLTAPVSLARKTAHYIYQGMSFTADVREGLQWPTLAEGETKLPLRFIAPAGPSPAEGDLTLVAPRVLYDGGRLLAEAEVVKAHLVQPRLVLSRPDADRLKLSCGDPVTVSRKGVSVDLPVQVNRVLAEGIAILPRNLAGYPAEKLVGPGGLYARVKVEKK